MIAYKILIEYLHLQVHIPIKYFWEFRTKIAIDGCGNVANMPYRSLGGFNNNNNAHCIAITS